MYDDQVVYKTMIKKIAIGLLAVLTTKTIVAQLTVDTTLTPTQLVQNVLLGSGITATNITYIGNIAARGSFNGTLSNIGFTSGFVMASGAVSNAIGPNNVGFKTSSFGTASSDPDLLAIATGTLHDAAILEFDFVPFSDSIKFRYVFGSEEYMEYAGSTFNDAFGFFITGPDPSGGNYSNFNIALIPNTTTPVSINNVNANVNGAYYFNNEFPPGQTVQYDGFTVPLIAKAPVICGQTYHIKIAISDVGDGSLDSGVFLEAGSFSSVGVQIIPEISYGGANDSTLYEGCGKACIYFVRSSNLDQQDTIDVTINGSAVNGVDYNTGSLGVLLPSQLIFGAGQDSISYCINAIADGVTEGLDTISLTIVPLGNCIQAITNARIYINE